MAAKYPELSVVIVVGDPGTRAGIERTLASLTHQCAIDQMEVVVIDCSRPDSPSMRGSEHRTVRTVKLPRERTTMAEARAEGVRQAKAPFVAFMDEHSFALAGWAEALIEAHQGPWAAVGAEIYNSSSAIGFADPIYLMGHGRWAPPARRGEMELLSSHDTCYKREVLLSYENQLSNLLMAEPILMWKLREDGHKLFLEPNAKSAHGYTITLLTLIAFMAWNRCFGHMRAKVFSWSRSKRYLMAGLTPILPWIRTLRLGEYLVRQHPQRLPTFLIGFPIILLAQYGAAIGEAMGLLRGKGNAETLFTQSHLRGLRWRAELPEIPHP
ncbi:MAG: glycosyltransferase family 2 protein [Anaerolineales bacterium]